MVIKVRHKTPGCVNVLADEKVPDVATLPRNCLLMLKPWSVAGEDKWTSPSRREAQSPFRVLGGGLAIHIRHSSLTAAVNNDTEAETR